MIQNRASAETLKIRKRTRLTNTSHTVVHPCLIDTGSFFHAAFAAADSRSARFTRVYAYTPPSATAVPIAFTGDTCEQNTTSYKLPM